MKSIGVKDTIGFCLFKYMNVDRYLYSNTQRAQRVVLVVHQGLDIV